MTRINNMLMALALFEESASKHGDATEQGDYKIANKNYDKVLKAVTYIRENNGIDQLLSFLNHPSVGVRLAAATYLLSKYEKESIEKLEEISKYSGIHALTAETILNEWRKGNLKL